MLSGWILVLVGAVLCFAGIASTHIAVLVSGFGLAWLLADGIGASAGTALVIALAGAIAAWVLVRLVFKAALFFVGGLVGAVIGARLYTLLQPSGGSVVIAVVFVVAAAFLSGWLANRWSVRTLLVLTALGGAGLMLSGLARTTSSLAWLRAPDSAVATVIMALLWVGLAGLGWASQRRISARRLPAESSGARR
ncbi:MAG: DUF4203 domain-containing protein [Micrococcales bacterium]|nr:DUF4203 domain-containing protein [Micrococcales bacterium]